GGRPRIAGTRNAVDHIAVLWKQGHSAEEIVERVHPDLELAGVHAALAYYFANREEIERSIAEEELCYVEGQAQSLRAGEGPGELSKEERERRAKKLERQAALLRSRLSGERAGGEPSARGA